MGANEKAAKELRKSERFEVTDIVRIIDVPTGRDIGKLANISEEGLMIVGNQAIAENIIMQLSLVFDSESGRTPDISIGVESLWCQSDTATSSHWTGFYIIDISEQDLERIRSMVG